jgi:hypothetical protein
MLRLALGGDGVVAAWWVGLETGFGLAEPVLPLLVVVVAAVVDVDVVDVDVDVVVDVVVVVDVDVVVVVVVAVEPPAAGGALTPPVPGAPACAVAAYRAEAANTSAMVRSSRVEVVIRRCPARAPR